MIDPYGYELVDRLGSQKIVLDAENVQIYFLKEGAFGNIKKEMQIYVKLKKAGVPVPEIIYFYREGFTGYIITLFLKGFKDIGYAWVKCNEGEKREIAFLLGKILARIHGRGVLVDPQYSNFLVRNYFGHITIVALDFEYPFRISFYDITDNRDRVAALVHGYREYFDKGYK